MQSRSSTMAWDMMRGDTRLLAYPVIRILAGVALFAVMWPLIFDMSVMDVGGDLASVGDDIERNRATDEGRAAASSLSSHTDFGWLVGFFVINAFLGVFSLGALTGQAIAISRGENRSVVYGYVQALLRLPQLVAWWLLTIVVGFVISIIESHRVIGAIVGMILGAAWAILTFFSVTAIMATGCGPFGAIGRSKTTIVDCLKKVGRSASASDLRTLRRGLRVGGPLLAINVVLVLVLMVMLFVDIRALHQGGHGVTAGGFGAVVLLLVVNGAFNSALWAILKSTAWVWAEEGKLPEHVEASQFDDLFVPKGMNPTPVHS
ncbi:MAG: DUF6159 family protein [Planctomycetota bacterium]|jgi:hypothetical protein